MAQIDKFLMPQIHFLFLLFIHLYIFLQIKKICGKWHLFIVVAFRKFIFEHYFSPMTFHWTKKAKFRGCVKCVELRDNNTKLISWPWHNCMVFTLRCDDELSPMTSFGPFEWDAHGNIIDWNQSSKHTYHVKPPWLCSVIPRIYWSILTPPYPQMV